MTWNELLRDNERMIHLYMNWLESHSLTYPHALKIMTEVGRLNNLNQWILELPAKDFYSEAYIIFHMPADSKVNHLKLKKPVKSEELIK